MIDDTDRTVEYDPYLLSDLTPDSTELISESGEYFVRDVTTEQNLRAVEYGSDWTEEQNVDRTAEQNSVRRRVVEHYPDTTASHISTIEGKSPDLSVEQTPDSTDELITDSGLGHRFQLCLYAFAVVGVLATGLCICCFVYFCICFVLYYL